MPNLTLQAISSRDVLAMADGLVAGGNTALARQLYEYGERTAVEPHLQQRFRARAGLASQTVADRRELIDVAGRLELQDPYVFVGHGLATWMKTTLFLEDERFHRIATKHSDLLPLGNWQWNLQTVVWAAREARDIPGDFVELGVFRGHTTAFTAEYLDFQTWPKRWWLYDTFDGIPADQLNPGWEEKNRVAYSGTYSYQEVSERFASYPNIDVIMGRVPEILSKTAPDKIAFLHLDLNSAVAEIAALNALYDRVSPGGVIVLDDYGWASARAQHDAERAWFAERGREVLTLPTGQGVLVKRA